MGIIAKKIRFGWMGLSDDEEGQENNRIRGCTKGVLQVNSSQQRICATPQVLTP